MQPPTAIHSSTRSTLLALLLAAPTIAFAADPGDRLADSWSFNAYLENDLFVGTDRNYTNGIKLSWISPDATAFRDIDHAKWLRDLVDKLPYIHEDGLQRNVVLSLGQNIYTPEDIENPNFIPDDRPYAGWLYLGFGFHSKSERQLDSWDINLGIVGPQSLAEDAQKFVHKAIGSARPEGWDHQIGFEPALNLVYLNKRRLFQAGQPLGWKAELFAHYGGSLGNVATYLNAGIEARAGWKLPSDFGSSLIRMGADAAAPTTADDLRFAGGLESLGFALHAGYDIQATFRDIFLDGNTFRDSHSLDKKFWVSDATFGASLTAGSWKLTYNQAYRSRQYKIQPRTHIFASLTLSYAY